MAGEIKLDAFDIKILAALQKDAKMTKGELADAVGLSTSPCWNRVKRLEEAGVIRGYYTDIDMAYINKYSVYLVDIVLESHKKSALEKFEKAMEGVDAVIELYSMSGRVDYILKVVATNTEEYQQLFHNLVSQDIGILRYNGNMILRQTNNYNHASVTLIKPED